ncbi:hypothetical protein P7H12_10590 [Paenibacillus larvae]|nr:hypothetical protein [Paenibacillus larvae]MDT2263951.1 hypothetical protein [Paenibacillus larvae]
MDEVVDGLLKANPFLANKTTATDWQARIQAETRHRDTKDMNPFQLLKMGYGTKA